MRLLVASYGMRLSVSYAAGIADPHNTADGRSRRFPVITPVRDRKNRRETGRPPYQARDITVSADPKPIDIEKLIHVLSKATSDADDPRSGQRDMITPMLEAQRRWSVPERRQTDGRQADLQKMSRVDEPSGC